MLKETYILNAGMGTSLPNYFVITGKIAKSMREELLSKLVSYPENTCFYIDFNNVDIIDFTGANELVSILQSRLKGGEAGNRYICLINLKEQHQLNIEQSLIYRNLAIVYKDKNDDSKILGSLNSYLSKTFYYIVGKKTTYAKEMSRDMEIPLNTAGTRMLNLFHEQLVVREENPSENGGKQYSYITI